MVERNLFCWTNSRQTQQLGLHGLSVGTPSFAAPWEGELRPALLGGVMQSPEQRRFSQRMGLLLNHLGTFTKMLAFTKVAATLSCIPLCINCSSASELPL